MSMTIMRKINFCAGHRLHKHGGKCEFFHGHNYVAEFYITSSTVDRVGRVVDFAHVKEVFKGWIDEHWDHGFLLYEQDENGINAIQQVVPTKYFLLPTNPTAESMAQYLLDEVCPLLLEKFNDYELRATKVVIWETENSFAAAEAEPHAVTPNVVNTTASQAR